MAPDFSRAILFSQITAIVLAFGVCYFTFRLIKFLNLKIKYLEKRTKDDKGIS